MQNLQFFLLAIKFFSNEIGAVIDISQKEKEQNLRHAKWNKDIKTEIEATEQKLQHN